MSALPQNVKTPDTSPQAMLSREEMAKREIGHTDMTLWAKRLLLMVFIVSIIGVPLVQLAVESTDENSEYRAAAIGRIVPDAKAVWETSEGSAWNRLKRTNATVLRAINNYEDDVERGSFLRDAVLPPIQSLLISHGAGNEKAYCGRDGWLFYRPSIDLLTGAGFLEPMALERRGQGGNEWQAAPHSDPRVAIIGFHKELERLGIQLVVMPTPVKAMIHPEKFAVLPDARETPMLNASHATFVKEMEEAGVLVFDPTMLLYETAHARLGVKPAYLATDTHWLPEAMDLVAKELAHFLSQKVDLSESSQTYQRREIEVQALGDIAAMLQLPESQALYPEEAVTIQQVSDSSGRLWEAREESELLLLGDSFSNIYSLEGMGWGKSAGFAEQVSYHLRRPLDTILRNDSGAFATRQILAGELARGRDRLKGKRIVVWQFAARELAVGDWKPIALPELPAIEPKPTLPMPKEESSGETWIATVSGVVSLASSIPEEGVPYKDHIRSLHLKELSTAKGSFSDPDAVVFVWDMRERKLTPEARLRPGDRITVRVRPWDDVSATLGRVNRSELDDLDLLLALPWWGEVVR